MQPADHACSRCVHIHTGSTPQSLHELDADATVMMLRVQKPGTKITSVRLCLQTCRETISEFAMLWEFTSRPGSVMNQAAVHMSPAAAYLARASRHRTALITCRAEVHGGHCQNFEAYFEAYCGLCSLQINLDMHYAHQFGYAAAGEFAEVRKTTTDPVW